MTSTPYWLTNLLTRHHGLHGIQHTIMGGVDLAYEYCPHCKDFIAEITKQLKEARIGAVTELKRRWNEDRKTMDYSPATYQFICDKYLAELKQRGGVND